MTVEVRSYGPSGSGAYLVPARRKGVTWLDELNAWGTGSVQVHKSDPVLVANPLMFAHGRIIKFFYEGAERFAFRVERRETQVVSSQEEAGKWITVSGRGVATVLDDAVVYPESGLERMSGDERHFTFAAKTGSWYVPAEWVAPLGVRQDADPTARGGAPADWPDGAAEWIWPTDPTTAVAGGTTAFFRATLTLAAATTVKFYATADDEFDLFVDGEIVLSSDTAVQFAWRVTSSVALSLAAGSHVIAARARNTTLADGALNPAGFLMTAATVNTAGDPVTYLLRTDTTNWLCHTDSPVPGWRAAHILATMLTEAQARSVTALASVTTDFTATLDSAGVAWTDRQDLAVRIGFEKVLDVTAKLVESSIDVNMTPGLVLQAWKRRGTDRSTGGSPVTLAAGVSLIDHKVTSSAATATRLLVRSGLGWVESTDAAGETASGRKEAGVSVGGAQSDGTAAGIAAATFAETSTERHLIESGQMPPRTGAKPYVDFFIGDDVLTPGEAGTNVKARIASLSIVEDDNGQIQFTPELFV